MQVLSGEPLKRERLEPSPAPDPQVVEKARRRRLTAVYTLGLRVQRRRTP